MEHAGKILLRLFLLFLTAMIILIPDQFLFLIIFWPIPGLVMAFLSCHSRGPQPNVVIAAAFLGPAYLPIHYFTRTFPFEKKTEIESCSASEVRKIQYIFERHGIEQPSGPFSAWKPKEKEEVNNNDS